MLAFERGGWRTRPTISRSPSTRTSFATCGATICSRTWRTTTLTFRNKPDQLALPMRRLGLVPSGRGRRRRRGPLERAGVALPSVGLQGAEPQYRALRRGRVNADDMTVQDYPRHLRGAGAALRQVRLSVRRLGQGRQPQRHIAAGRQSVRGRARRANIPIRRWTMTYGPSLFAKAAAEVGYHPFPHPAANMSRPYTNPLGVQLGQCTYCGFCEKFGCGNYSKSSPQTTILPVLMREAELHASHLLRGDEGRADPRRQARDRRQLCRREWRREFQPANMVILSPSCSRMCG